MTGVAVRAASYMMLLFGFISLFVGADEQQPVGVHRCISKERRALLDFKKGLTDPSNRLSSWSPDEDCCHWAGVYCQNITGAVTLLDLHNPHPSEYNGVDKHGFPLKKYALSGYISPSLLQLESLTYLDLSYNDFQGAPIPSFFGSLTSLWYLNLDDASFGGLVPSQLQNLYSIRYLNLRYNQGLRADSLGWIAHLPSLEYLDMSLVDLHGVEADWLGVVSMLPSLSELHFLGCQLDSMIPPRPLGHVNFSSLQVLHLSDNEFSSRIPDWLFNLSSSIRILDLSFNSLNGEIPEMITTLRMLEYLDLYDNSLSGMIPPGIGQLKHLQSLRLGYNKLSGSVPWSIGNLTSLSRLDLSDNQLNGTIPESISFLSNLESLSVTYNPMLRGIVSEAHLSTLPKLNCLDVSFTTLSLSVGPSWTPPFRLDYLYTSFSKIGPEFPSWLWSQTSLQVLDISMSGISDTAPAWFWKIASGIDYVTISGNQIHGDLTHAWFNSASIDISSNYFTGQLPHLSPNVNALSIRNNSVSGGISTFICGESNRNNKLKYLDISMNNLSGELSECWTNWQSLVHLNLGSNNLSGKIPATIGSLSQLRALLLSQNSLFGDIPLSLNNCTSLRFIDLGENKLSGLIPYWIPERETMLVLRLRSNKFTGHIPVQLCLLSSIQVLDLGNNNLSGTIPKCLSNFSSMADKATNTSTWYDSLQYIDEYIAFDDSLELVTKGTESIYQRNLRLVKLIDFSNNMLSGTIPTDISRLAGLRFLNLSRNHLVGQMPKEIGNMSNLESLDLSRNQLAGQIPESISKLSFLNNLDLSFNNLSGSIPLATQVQSFNESSFLGNVGLCGAPLSKPCRNDTHQGPKEDAGQESDDNMFWFYVGAGPGFAGAFCGVCSVLYFKPAWRQALFWFLEDLMNNVYVFAYVKKNRIKRRLKRSENTAAS